MNILTNTQNATSPALYPKNAGINAEPLAEEHKQEALAFLSQRPVNTAILSGWIHDHGIVSPKHRGTFYGCRNADGDLTGVAMIGRYLLFEACSDDAVTAFARSAREFSDVQMVFAEEEKLVRFWSDFRGETPMPAMSRHRLISSGGPIAEDVEFVNELRVATRDELDNIVAAHAEMVLAETGVDPLLTDADGFRMRCSQRVEDGRVWVWVRDGELIFKADIVSITPAAIYAEGLWVNPKHRGNGYSTRALASMCRQLLSGSNMICGFMDADHPLSDSLYRSAGFTTVDEYAKIYL